MADNLSHDSKAGKIIATAVSTTAIAAIAVILRIISRVKILGIFGKEDWMIVVSLIISIGVAIIMGIRVHYGLGQHIWNVPASNAVPGLKAFYFAVITYSIALTTVKASILFQYLRIFDIPAMRKACYINMAIVAVYGVWLFFSSVFNCIPVAYAWDKTIKGGKCLPYLPLWYGNSITNILTDFAIFILPIPVLGHLKMHFKQKLTLIAIFGVGFFICIVSILRLHTLKIAADGNDPTWDYEGAATWSMVELNLGITCACLPTLKPLIAKIIPSFSSQNRTSRGVYYGRNTGVSRNFTSKSQTRKPNDNTMDSTERLQRKGCYDLEDLEDKKGGVSCMVRASKSRDSSVSFARRVSSECEQEHSTAGSEVDHQPPPRGMEIIATTVVRQTVE